MVIHLHANLSSVKRAQDYNWLKLILRSPVQTRQVGFLFSCLGSSSASYASMAIHLHANLSSVGRAQDYNWLKLILRSSVQTRQVGIVFSCLGPLSAS